MARLPQIIRRGNISQVAAQAPRTGGGAWAVLADAAAAGAEIYKNPALEQAQEEGLNAVYRDANGQLAVDDKGPFAGMFGDAYNTAAFAKYLSQKSIDMGATFTELATKYQFDPAGFNEAKDLYIQSIRAEEGVPARVKEQVAQSAEREGANRFNGIYRQEVERTQREADVNTNTHRDMLADDYVNLVMGGDLDGAEEKYAELEELSRFRKEAPYITETEAQTEAYLRGVRGEGKAAQLTRRLENMSGAESISDEERAEIEQLLQDEDLDPRARQSLYAATQGRLKSIDANTIVKGLTDDSLESKVVRVESSGRANAQNPNSSATGPHQFIEGTWLDLVERHKPGWAQGKSRQEILNMRKNADASSEMYQHFRRENQAALTSAGIPINDTTEYMAHFFGADGTSAIWYADPFTPVQQLITKKAYDANPHLHGMTARDAINWAGRKMTMKASDIAAQRVQIDQIDDAEVRALAAHALNEQFNVRRRYEQQFEEQYADRVDNGDDTLTEQEIMENHDLSDEAQKTLVNELRKSRSDQMALIDTLSDLNNEDVYIDTANSDTRKALDNLYDNAIEGADPRDDAADIGAAVNITRRTGRVPKSMFNALRSGVMSDDPEEVAHSIEIANRMQVEDPRAFTMHDGRSNVLNALSDYKVLAGGGMTATEAAQAMIDTRDVPKNVSDQARELSKDLKPKDILQEFDDANFNEPRFGTKNQDHDVKTLMPDYLEAVMMGEYKTLFETEYKRVGNFERAKQRALDTLGRVYGPNHVTGDMRIMKFPPQKVYGAFNGSHDWMTEQVQTEITEFAGTEIGSENIHLVSDAQTRREVSMNEAPSYQVYYWKDGVLEQHPRRMFFSEGSNREAFEQERTEQMQEFDVDQERRDTQQELTQGILDRFEE